MKIGLKLHHRSVITYSYQCRIIDWQLQAIFHHENIEDAVNQSYFVMSVPFEVTSYVYKNF